MKFEVKHRVSGEILFSIEADSPRLAVEAAVKAGANLTRANLAGANLAWANLAGADLTGANLTGADLTRANLAGADLTRADLTGANLTGADLTRANLAGADLTRANLAEANLAGADLTRAKLAGADLAMAKLAGAMGVNKYLTTPLYGLLDQHDPLVAYKLVTAEGVGPYQGGITYVEGQTYEEPNADTKEDHDCGTGIHLASLDWCVRHYEPGFRILLAEFTKADLAAIPIGSDGKFRVRRCRIVGEKSLAELGIRETP